MSFDFQAAYDELNPADDDYRFYAALAHELGSNRVLDLGCGTGVLARLLAGRGHPVVGIDPDPDMLRVARTKPGAGQVDWRLGYSDCADTGSVDLAVMTGHVAQVFVDDADWHTVLTHLHRALAPGGTLAFETRNPGARGWEAWTREATLRTMTTDDGPVEFWHQTVEVDLPHVTYDTCTRNIDTGEASQTRNRLAFRDSATLRASLSYAGFEIVTELGDWSKRPLTDASPEIIVVAGRH